jgi:hypothetical protein
MSSRFAHVLDSEVTPVVVEVADEHARTARGAPDVPSFRIAASAYATCSATEPDCIRPARTPAPEKQLKAIGAMILETEASAIAFEEVQNRAILAKVIRVRQSGWTMG